MSQQAKRRKLTLIAPKDKVRCGWTKGKDFYDHYHDTEWGEPVHDDHKHFEMLILEGAQAGLSWETILLKRDGYRKAFRNFRPDEVANMTDEELESLRNNSEIVRNKLKIYATRSNARIFLSIQEEFGSFDCYVWGFVGRTTKINRWQSLEAIPTSTPESDLLSADLKRRGMKFVGTTIMYAYMQAVGLVNDHVVTCWKCPQAAV